jgi:hypothetical protein
MSIISKLKKNVPPAGALKKQKKIFSSAMKQPIYGSCYVKNNSNVTLKELGKKFELTSS